MYGLAQKLLFNIDPELSHELTLDWLGAAERLHLLKLFTEQPKKPVKVMGINFPNPVGLSAGMDKNGDYIDAFARLGFGFIEIGTVTPLPQPGNPQPRIFRLKEHNAIINRMGFNNKGMKHLIAQVKQRKQHCVLGINVGKNKDTPEEHALSDYQKCMAGVYQYADYIAINISSPNTPGLRDLQYGDALTQLLAGIKESQRTLADEHGRYVPVVVKIAPDMDSEKLNFVAQTLLEAEIDGIIATNTTIHRNGVTHSVYANEAGGLSGAPLRDKSTQIVADLARALDGKIPIIGVGGILSGADAKAKMDAGASLVQLYTGLIYRGPALIKEAVNAL